MPFIFRKLEIPDVILVEPKVFPDRRGFFMETYKRSEFEINGISVTFVQDNFSHSVKGVLRGLRYQRPPKAQGKLVMVIRGRIFDVAVDLRKGSPTYGRWVGVELSSEEPRMFWIPEGFAHGFQVLSDEADVLYKVTAEYAPELDAGVRWDDSDLAIPWPIKNPILSKKDASLPYLKNLKPEFIWEGSSI